MKKHAIAFLSLFLFAPSVWAATIASDYENVVDKNEALEISPIKITSTSAGDITAMHGINILLDTASPILWGEGELTVTGTAREKGKVDLNIQPVYSADRKSVFIPVLKDFETGEWLTLQGLILRGYKDSFENQYLGLDLNGDLQAEVTDVNPYRVGATVDMDAVRPFPVRDASATLNQDGSVVVSWKLPPDYDYAESIIDRHLTINGVTQIGTVYKGYANSFTDTDPKLKDASAVTYEIFAKDLSNISDPVKVTLDLKNPVSASTPATPPSTPEPTPTDSSQLETGGEVSDEEIAAMEKLLDYYAVRYNIKCKPAGRTVSPSDSACLWSRIDLVYAQEVTGDERVSDLSLASDDLDLMTARRKWPEARYQQYCVNAPTPAAYCPGLKSALDRTSYFLD